MSKPYDVYYWPTPNGWKITILLEELAEPYNLVPVNIGAGEQFEPEFLAISPNNRMPALVDHQPVDGGEPISIFESGAIMQYLAEKHGHFWPQDWRGKYEVSQWLFWQMAGLGPNCGQTHHFRNYMEGASDYAAERFTNEVNRLYGVMDIRLADREFLAGDYSIADMACIGWIRPYKRQGQNLDEFPNLKRWYETMLARQAVEKGMAAGAELRQDGGQMSEAAKKVLFGQRARKA
ncbi:MAG: glutathione S-transferase N-terminal domain-containing protein [Alphaproteobacteria bacterium]|jgi:GST-like protein|nr:glutathione S-transferase N-terminal domain-containing protein [Alphaproteobacteria bacterium]MDP6563888.1 glutathione S-transferase N-terminal domain-containing protein [Alphaproteobacteria bacterium]MDP6815920.1 glutathione S-transferase N-terminal domain-containing protein [Alphaproteobacteria bacterium]